MIGFTSFEKTIMKYSSIICFYISKLKFSVTSIKYQIDTFWKTNYQYIIFEFRILSSKFLFLDFDFSKIIKTRRSFMKQKLYKLKIWTKKIYQVNPDEGPVWKIYQKSIRWILEKFNSVLPFCTSDGVRTQMMCKKLGFLATSQNGIGFASLAKLFSLVSPQEIKSF
jgi:hypothetical protein